MKNCLPANKIDLPNCEYSVGNLVRLSSPPNRPEAKEKRNMGIITEVCPLTTSTPRVKVLWPKIGVEEYWAPTALEIIDGNGKPSSDSA